MVSYFLLIPSVTGLSAALTVAMLRYAVKYSVLDVPNGRSAHSAPTPRGGGLAIVISFTFSLFVLAWHSATPWETALVLAGAGGLVAAVGLVDDHRPLSVRARLSTHVVAALAGLAGLGGLGAIEFGGVPIDLGWPGDLFGVVVLVWLLNLYNFMDGIDGLAGVEAVTVSFSAAVLAWQHSAGDDAGLAALLGASTLGFLLLNWPPARIFMGDTGSGFLGLMAGLLAVRAGHTEPRLLWVWVVLLGVFVVDATTTLVRRLLMGGEPFRPHRDHAYQHVSRKWSHRKTTATIALINLCWLLPVAFAVIQGTITGVAGVALAYLPLIGVAIWQKAGVRSNLTARTANP